MATITIGTRVECFTCGLCGGLYALGEEYVDEKRLRGGFWNCPYCKHSWGYQKEGSLLEREKKARLIAEAQTARERALHDQTKQALKSAEAKVRRVKKRIANGVCPCCNRHFKQLHQHIKTKHPEYVAS